MKAKSKVRQKWRLVLLICQNLLIRLLCCCTTKKKQVETLDSQKSESSEDTEIEAENKRKLSEQIYKKQLNENNLLLLK